MADGVPPGTGDSLGSALVRGALAIVWLAAGRQASAEAELAIPTPHRAQLAAPLLLARLVSGDVHGIAEVLDRIERWPGHTIRSRGSVATLGAAIA